LIFYFLFFLPNVALNYFSAVAGASHLWSIGVEEQFYLFWPIIFFIRNVRVKLIVICGIACLPYLQTILSTVTITSLWADKLSLFPFHWMAFGGIGAFIYWRYNGYLERVLLKNTIWSWLVVFVFLFVGLLFKIHDYLFGIIGLMLILRFSIGQQNFSTRFSKLTFLGKISFGLYIYHPMVMFLVLSSFQYFLPNWSELFLYKVAAYCCIFCITVAIAWISYRFYEKPFIQLKDSKFKSI